MRVAVSSTADVKQLRRVMERKFRPAIIQGVHNIAEYIREEARGIVPVDTGALKASITVSSYKSDDYQQRQIEALGRLEKAKREYIRGKREGVHSTPEQFTTGPKEFATRGFLKHQPAYMFIAANVYPQMPYAEPVEYGHTGVPAKPYMVPAAAIGQRDADFIMSDELSEAFGLTGRFKGSIRSGAPNPRPKKRRKP